MFAKYTGLLVDLTARFFVQRHSQPINEEGSRFLQLCQGTVRHCRLLVRPLVAGCRRWPAVSCLDLAQDIPQRFLGTDGRRIFAEEAQ